MLIQYVKCKAIVDFRASKHVVNNKHDADLTDLAVHTFCRPSQPKSCPIQPQNMTRVWYLLPIIHVKHLLSRKVGGEFQEGKALAQPSLPVSHHACTEQCAGCCMQLR